mmetsp:Transcript_30871/g.49498  ORF Transcript_30871/g.49498 Transcript_30871/m.49498 type:complete len:816 (-) Transcript_30871:625-3072(-)
MQSRVLGVRVRETLLSAVNDGFVKSAGRSAYLRQGTSGRQYMRVGSRVVDLQTFNRLHTRSAVLSLTDMLPDMFSTKKPRGFEKFFPEDGDDRTEAKKASKSSGDEKDAEKREKDAEKDGSGFWSSSGEGGGKDGGSGGGGPGGDNESKGLNVGSWMAGALSLYLLYTLSRQDGNGANGKEINWQEFKTHLLAAGQVERVVIVNKQYAKVYVKSPSLGPVVRDDGLRTDTDRYAQAATTRESSDISGDHGSQYYFNIGSVDSFERKLDLAQRELGLSSKDFVPVQYIAETNWFSEAGKLVPTFLIIAAWLFMMRNMGGGAGGGGMNNIFKIGKANVNMVGKDKNVGVNFKDVAGCDEAKMEIMEFVEFLKDPKKFTKLGAKIPKGALLCGPPGTGKTLLAKATAGEASVPFFSISGSDFIEMFVGVGPSRVRDLFGQARKNAPCIVFIDEIDAVARARGKGGFSGGNDERENTLNQLLVEMDGFSTKEGVVVLAGTNRIDILDQAILRPGRFDRQIKVDLPDIKGRKEIFEVHLKELDVNGSKEEVAQRMAALTPGFAGAQIANVCNEAAILAARKDESQITMDCFEGAVDRVIGGLEKKNSVMTQKELRTVAYHEAGHAIVGWYLEHCDPLLKVTIIPRMSGALGFAQYLPKELALHTEQQLVDRMCMALGGRAAEEVTFGNVTTGAQDDLDKVTKIAYSMVSIFGMNSRVGTLSFPEEEGAMVKTTRYSEATAEIIDQEVKELVSVAYDRTKALLTEKKADVEAVAEYLLKNETITQHDIADLIGPRPFPMPQSYEEFIKAAAHKTTPQKNDE